MIEQKVGDSLTFFYYQFIHEYHREPEDLVDFFDGLNAWSARVAIDRLE